MQTTAPIPDTEGHYLATVEGRVTSSANHKHAYDVLKRTVNKPMLGRTGTAHPQHKTNRRNSAISI